MTGERLPPRYQGGSIADVLPSVCDGLRVPQSWDILGLGEATRVVVLVVDGLGHRQLRERAEVAPFLSGVTGRVITSVFPSTTPTGLTSIGTGVPAGEHGIMGAAFRLPETGSVLHPLAWYGEPSAAAVQPHPTWWELADRAGVAVSVVSPRSFASGGLTGCALRGGRYVGADGPGERIAEIAASAADGERSLVYAYWEALDKTAHIHGVGSPHYSRELAVTDSFVAGLTAALPSGTRLIITADHGVIDCDTDVQVDLPPFTEGVQLVAGEPRMRQVYCSAGTAADVAATWREALGDGAEVLTRSQVMDSGLYGRVDPAVAGRIGDVVAIARGRVRLTAPSRDSILSSLRGQHGALTPDEMEVPLLVADV